MPAPCLDGDDEYRADKEWGAVEKERASKEVA